MTGKPQEEIAGILGVSRTTLHYYRTGQTSPKASALYRLEQAERQARAAATERRAETGTARLTSDRPLPAEEPELFADERPRTEIELARHLRWLQGARLRQQEAALAAQRHLHEIDGWVYQTEAELNRVRAAAGEEKRPKAAGKRQQAKTGGRRAAIPKEKRAVLRDIDTVSLPIFGALPAGWPQTREGVMQRRPIKTLRVRRGRFPEGAFGLEVRGDSMNAARPTPVFDGDVVVLLSPEQREPQAEDIVAALIDGETCLKRLKTRKRPAGAFLKSESMNPAHGEIHPAHELVIQGVFVGKL